MTNSKILVIDDSATIRRLASNTLSSAGYDVILAENADEGVRLARKELPNMILLDHQLPGTTGVSVCSQLLAEDVLKAIPVIVSSTLRKQAYVEYADCHNVIDMLPKPYNEELLKSSVEQAITTGSMVVDSQASGTAVPEVINQVGSSELAGDFKQFSLREVLDFLNNGSKTGVLEVESVNSRTRFYLDKGRIQAVTANGIDSSLVVGTLPGALTDLAPVLKLAISGRDGSELQGLVQLLNNKVLDPRLLRKLLRHQAAMLTFITLQSEGLRDFRFESGTSLPPLFRDLPLDVSLAALLVEGAIRSPSEYLPKAPSEYLPKERQNHVWARRAIRGQNLDRAGMTTRHQRIIGILSQPQSVEHISKTLGWDEDETLRVVYGLSLADLLEVKTKSLSPRVLIFEPDDTRSQMLRTTVANQDKYEVRVVKDRLSIQLVMKRECPQFLVLPQPSHDEDFEFLDQLTKKYNGHPDSIRIIHVCSDPPYEDCLPPDFSIDQLWALLGSNTQRHKIACSVLN